MDQGRINEILDKIAGLAALDYDSEIDIKDNNDELAAIAVGLNMLGEELKAQVVSKNQLTNINSKLEKFAYSTAHDLKSPLNAIAGLVSLIELYSQPENDDLKACIGQLKTVVSNMKNMVIGILNYSRSDSNELDFERLNLHELIQSVIRQDGFGDLAQISIKDQLPVVWFNKISAIQVVRNIFDNAIKYCDKPLCEIAVNVYNKEAHYEIEIKDNGPGIDPKDQSQIFDLFNSLNQPHNSESFGIGLANVKQILQSSGEKIWVESELGAGATFIFTLKKENHVQRN